MTTLSGTPSAFNLTNMLSYAKLSRENFANYYLFFLVVFIAAIYLGYLFYQSRLQGVECDYMNKLYPSVVSNIQSISSGGPDLSGNLRDYYINTAFNACCGGGQKNDYVDICSLKAVLKTGVRCIDFEIYSINNEPVIASSTDANFYVKESFNSVPFSSVMMVLNNYAFSGGTVPNPSDPLIMHLRIKSNNVKMYEKMSSIFKQYDNILLGPKYSYENDGLNIGGMPLLSFQNKIIIIVEKNNTSFLENKNFMEYVNMTSESLFMRKYNYFDVKNIPDVSELEEYNKKNMSIVLPDIGLGNSNGILTREMGVQMCAMKFQQVDSFLEENESFYAKNGFAFVLKPERLRYEEVKVALPEQQKPELSYGTRNVKTDYYNFNY